MTFRVGTSLYSFSIFMESSLVTVQDLQKKELKKHVAAIRISNNVGLLARKSWNVLLLNAYDSLFEKKVHQMPIDVLSNVIGYNSKSYKSLNIALEKLQTTLIEWDLGGGCEVKGMWVKNLKRSQMLGTVYINNGIIHYEFSHMLAEELHNPDIYHRINITQQKIFRSSHALALWENCIRFLSVGSTGYSEVDEWKNLLGATSKAYKEFKRFNALVLSPAIKEVNAVSGIHVELLTRKTGRRITHIAFSITENKNQKMIVDKVVESKNSSPEYEELLSFGIHKVQAIKWIEEHGLPYIRQKLALLKETQSQKELKNPSGFLVKSINEDYQSANEIAKAKEAERKKKELAAKRRKEAEEKLQNEYEKYKKQTTENFWDVFPPSVKNIMLKDFETKLDDMTLQAYKKYSLESAMVLSNFRNFLREEHMQNGEILSFQDWKKNQKKKS